MQRDEELRQQLLHRQHELQMQRSTINNTRMYLVQNLPHVAQQVAFVFEHYQRLQNAGPAGGQGPAGGHH